MITNQEELQGNIIDIRWILLSEKTWYFRVKSFSFTTKCLELSHPLAVEPNFEEMWTPLFVSFQRPCTYFILNWLITGKLQEALSCSSLIERSISENLFYPNGIVCSSVVIVVLVFEWTPISQDSFLSSSRLIVGFHSSNNLKESRSIYLLLIHKIHRIMFVRFFFLIQQTRQLT